MRPAETLRRAADHMEQVGFNQDGHYYRDEGGTATSDPTPTSLRPCCTIGAIMAVNDSHLDLREAAIELAHDLGHPDVRYPHDVVVTWNDRPETTRDDVLARLRGTAERLAAEEAAA